MRMENSTHCQLSGLQPRAPSSLRCSLLTFTGVERDRGLGGGREQWSGLRCHPVTLLQSVVFIHRLCRKMNNPMKGAAINHPISPATAALVRGIKPCAISNFASNNVTRVARSVKVRQENTSPANKQLVLLVSPNPHFNLLRALVLVSCWDRLVLGKATIDLSVAHRRNVTQHYLKILF